MSGVFKAVGSIASVVALVPGPWQPIAQAVAVVASVGAALTAKPPAARGSISQIQIGANLPTPYLMGRTYIGGNQEHDVGYGGSKNPYRSMVFVYSGAGPIQSIEAFQADYTTINFSGAAATGYYAGFLWRSTQLGACPEPSALSGPQGAIPRWGAAYKLSGYAASLVTLKFDKDGKRFASGVPQFGIVARGVKVYDPRQDSTYPGGSGSARPLQETTYVGGTAAENPGCHGVTYALGRYQNGKKVMGCGFAVDAIDWPAWVGFANVCDANGWKIGGAVYEPGSRWDNLKAICEAGGGEPFFAGGKLSVRYSAPKVSLFTITGDDLADGDYSVPAMTSWRDRKNSVVPKIRLETHKWEYVQLDAVTVASLVAEDGEEKQEEVPFSLVQEKDQAAELAAYRVVNSREFGPIVLPCKPWLAAYRPGEVGTVNIPELGLVNQLCEIRQRQVDVARAVVTLSLMSESTVKHAYALGQSGTAPATPTITGGEDLDTAVSDANSSAPIVVADDAAMVALDVVAGTTVKVTATGQTWQRNDAAGGSVAGWTLIGNTAAATAATTAFTPVGTIVGTNVQDAIAELAAVPATTAVTLATGWSNLGSPYGGALVRRAEDGLIAVQGTVIGSGTATTLIGTLPAGYRPGQTRFFAGQNGSVIRTLEVRANGEIYVGGTGTDTTTSVSLSSILFYP
ncbi:hypothetical protein [Sphingosinicella sp. BN140058]|uniref:hypothetical protein n=1 Tax=Sphingosinicella sp. BN140058 TaxID=1892855 RepID=UPI001010E3D8|nr:hypothetical protein [Sphingosinicella sp. BN140058]QAY77930.1 hypothetical protein ETR14_16420 [Sphingosinicella sp. BN140058]